MNQQYKFEPHGDYSLAVEAELIIVKASGAWNEQGKRRIMQDVLGAIRRLNAKRFSMLVDVSDFELGTPEFQRVSFFEKVRLIQLGLNKTAYVNQSNRQAHLQQIAMMQPQIQSFQWGVFDNIDSAQGWLVAKPN